MELTAHEQRVLGCLIEKQRTTPDVYPLSLNALRGACNQSTNREPVLAMTEDEVRDACQALYRHGLARLASGAGSRTIKYRHLAPEALQVGDAELALLAVLLLRGPQTVGELRTRTERLYAFASTGAVTAVLERLAADDRVVLLEREPGRKEPRWAHLLGAAPAQATGMGTGTTPAPASSQTPPAPELAAVLARLGELEARVAALESASAER